MEKRGMDGHRQRMRNTYINAGADAMDDCKLLELYLSLVIPRKDVRELSYDLINTFGSLDGVFSASISQLMRVNGIGENTAVLISLNKDIQNRIAVGSAKSLVFDRLSVAVDYVEKRLSGLVTEKLLVIALNNCGEYIGEKFFESRGVNFVDANPKAISEFLLFSNASGVIVGHNHPSGYSSPSASDCNFTCHFRDMLDTFEINLIDHIIVGKDGPLSMRHTKPYDQYFINNEGAGYESINA